MRLEGPIPWLLVVVLPWLTSCGGGGGGGGSTGPRVTAFARFADVNRNGVLDAGDTIVVRFDATISVVSGTVSELDLPVTGDSFGTGATVTAGPASNELTVTLGAGASLKSRQTYGADTGVNSPSGIDVAASPTEGAIIGSDGTDITASTAVDVIPVFVSSGQSLGTADSRALAVGDVDGDGDLDVVVGNASSGANVVYLNAAGVLTASQSLGTSSTRGVALGDIDGDGDL
ncbi:MAG: VCBS repeat-containing protein, partial [Planctomycetes bacterium]|nr:VCBS repeat-containing protein [Planctomycetota bacterium]